MSLTITVAVDIEPQPQLPSKDGFKMSSDSLSDSGKSSWASCDIFASPGELLSDEEFSQEFSSHSSSRRSSADFINPPTPISTSDDFSIVPAPPPPPPLPHSYPPPAPPPPPLPGYLTSLSSTPTPSTLFQFYNGHTSPSSPPMLQLRDSLPPSPSPMLQFRDISPTYDANGLLPAHAYFNEVQGTTRCSACFDSLFVRDVKFQKCCNTLVCSDCLSGTFHGIYSQNEYDYLVQQTFPDVTLPCLNRECQQYISYVDLNARRPVTGTCIVCFDEFFGADVKRKCCSEVVCKSCINQIVNTSVLDEGKTHIVCPNPECKEGVFSRDEILQHLSAEGKEKYKRFQLKENGENSGRKTCPNCCWITEHKLPSRFKRFKEEDVHITCSKCQYDWCFRCHSPWHNGISCRHFQKGDKQFKKWTKSKALNGAANCQKCPLCRVYIQRSTGCDHMTCNRCRTEFCYKCGGFYNGLPFLGDHHEPTSVFGCKFNYKKDQPVQRKALRGGYVGAKLAMLTGYPVLFVAGLAMVVVVGAVALPIYGGYRLYKFKKRTRNLYKPRRRHH